MVSPLTPPPNPYGTTGATLIGEAGQFAILPGVEVRVGRDASMCPICLSEPRISGVHATLKLESGKVLVRDEHSNNGSFIDEARTTPGTWMEAPGGSTVRFGPVSFTVRLG